MTQHFYVLDQFAYVRISKQDDEIVEDGNDVSDTEVEFDDLGPDLVIDTSFQRFMHRYTFNLESCPLLIYIHNDSTVYSNVFCQQVLCSDDIIDYMNEHYIVRSFDVTNESCREELDNNWRETFHTTFSGKFSIEQCPLLIGVMPISIREVDDSITLGYRYKLLFKDGHLFRYANKTDHDVVLKILADYLKKFNSEDPSSDFISKIDLYRDIALEISEYLTLNDAVNVFSADILSQRITKLRLNKSTDDAFMQMIQRRINPKQIHALSMEMPASSVTFNLPTFTNITSLHIIRFTGMDELIRQFPKLNSVSLIYKDTADCSWLYDDIILMKNQIKRLKINCDELPYNFHGRNMAHSTIKSFSFQFSTKHFSSQKDCSNCKNSMVSALIDLMISMSNVRYFHIIGDEYHINVLLREISLRLRRLSGNNFRMKKMTLHIPTPGDIKQIQQRSSFLQRELRSKGRTIDVQVKHYNS
ncbi:unnamed protein product [Adineta ricciae]|uniref:Fas-associated factor 1/2-like UAS domain-containing protein n=1 Tax=Adineta ricciae TaxID=249248 RepID=A0A813QSI4_ADIRI|nr:unnamed protein product [Adineta ricciae]